MKLKNKLLNSIVAVGMLAIVLLSNVPLSYADSFVSSLGFKKVNTSNPNYYEEYCFDKSMQLSYVTFYNPSQAYFCHAYFSTVPWDRSIMHLVYKPKYGGGTSLEKSESSKLSDFEFTYNGTTYYVGYYSELYQPNTQTFSGTLGAMYTSSDNNLMNIIEGVISDYIIGYDKFMEKYDFTEVEDATSTDESTWSGSQDNPKNDTDIGYLVLKNTNVNQQSDLGTLKDGVLPLYFNFDWENKTSTGLSLTKNKYARTFIQVEVESKFVVYSDTKHTKVKHKFDNYGERGWLSKNIDPSNKPATFDTSDINNALPKTYSEILSQVDKNKMYGSLGQAVFPIGYNFLLRYRVVCTDSLTVIPDSSSGWYAGPWASTTLSADDVNDTSSSKSDHEGYGDDKESNGDSDDINHSRTDYDDNQDAKDNIGNSSVDSSDLTIDKAIAFLKQVTKVPKMIKNFLSFLPDWVVAPFFLAFGLLPILIIYKFIKG